MGVAANLTSREVAVDGRAKTGAMGTMGGWRGCGVLGMPPPNSDISGEAGMRPSGVAAGLGRERLSAATGAAYPGWGAAKGILGWGIIWFLSWKGFSFSSMYWLYLYIFVSNGRLPVKRWCVERWTTGDKLLLSSQTDLDGEVVRNLCQPDTRRNTMTIYERDAPRRIGISGNATYRGSNTADARRMPCPLLAWAHCLASPTLGLGRPKRRGRHPKCICQGVPLFYRQASVALSILSAPTATLVPSM